MSPDLLFILPALAFLILSLRGTPVLSSPKCRKCNYDLRTLPFLTDSNLACPECGSHLAHPRAVSFGTYRRAPRRILLALLLILLSFALPPLISLVTRKLNPAPRPVIYGAITPQPTNAQLLTNIQNGKNHPWSWRDIEQRYAAHAFSKSEIDQAVSILIAELNAEHSRDGFHRGSAYFDEFIRALLQNHELSPARTNELYQAFYSQCPDLVLRPNVRTGDPIPAHLSLNTPYNIDNNASPVLSLGPIIVDGSIPLSPGSAIPYPKAPHFLTTRPVLPATRPDQFSTSRSSDLEFSLPQSLPPGRHELSFTFDLGIVDIYATRRGFDGELGPPEKWPHPHAHWQATTRRSITVLPADQSPVQLVTNPADNPFHTFTLSATALTRPTTKGLDLVLDWTYTGSPSTPLAYSVTIHAGTQTIPFVPILIDPGPDDSPSFFTWTTIPPLSPDIRSIDITLTPNPQLAESSPTTTRIWAQPHTLKNIPLARYDLPEK